MRHLTLEPERVLAAGERFVHPPFEAHKCWLLLTDHRLLVLTPGHRHEPAKVDLAEELSRVQVALRTSWLGKHGLVIRAPGRDDRKVYLPVTKGRRTRFGMMRALREIVDEIEVWQAAARVAPAGEYDADDRELAYLRSRATACLTPAHLAGLLGTPVAEITALLPSGAELSNGATSGFTYTKRDAELFPESTRAAVLDRLHADLGQDEMLRRYRAAQGSEWWETSGGQAAEDLLDMFDLPVGHVSTRRTPIRSWERPVAWLGLLGAALFTAFSFGLLFPLLLLWRSSHEGWMDGTFDRPKAAIVLGLITLGLFVALPVAGVISAVVGLL